MLEESIVLNWRAVYCVDRQKSEVDKNSLFDNYPHKPPNNSVRSKGFPSCPTFVEDNFQLKA